MRKLLVFVVVLLVVADVAVRAVVEDEASERLRSEVPGIAGAEVDVDSFPFLGRLALDGHVSEVTVTLDEVVRQDLEVARLTARADGAELDRGELLEGRVLVRDVDRAAVTALVTEEALDVFAPSGVTVSLDPGEVRVEGPDGALTAELAVANGELQVDVDGAVPSFTVPLPTEELLPCEPSLTIGDGEAELSCTSTELPPVVGEAIAEAQ